MVSAHDALLARRHRLGTLDAGPPVLGPGLPVHAVAPAQPRPHAGLGGCRSQSLGIPAEEEYIATYCERIEISGVPHWTFCLAFSFFRLAAIVQGMKKRALEGNAWNPENARKSGVMVPVLAKMGAG